MSGMVGKGIYHDTTMVESQLTDNENRSREVLACLRERAPVKAPSMLRYTSREHIDSGRTAPQKYHSHDVASWRWAR